MRMLVLTERALIQKLSDFFGLRFERVDHKQSIQILSGLEIFAQQKATQASLGRGND